MTVTLLEWVVAGTGLLTLALSLWALWDSGTEWRVLRAARLNGLRWATVRAHVARDVTRVVASLVLAVAGVWLLRLPSDVDGAALVAKHALMFLGWLMSGAVLVDRAMRRAMRRYLDAL